MTVKELRRLLKDKPKDATVLLSGYSFGHPGCGVHFDMVSTRSIYNFYDAREPQGHGEKVEEEIVVLL